MTDNDIRVAAASDDPLRALIALRELLAERLAATTSAPETASLAARFADTVERIEALKAATAPPAADSPLQELARRRAARADRAGLADVAASAACR